MSDRQAMMGWELDFEIIIIIIIMYMLAMHGLSAILTAVKQCLDMYATNLHH